MAKNRKTSAEEYTSNRVLFIFSFAFVLILGLMAAYRGFSSFTTLFYTLYILNGVIAAGVAVAAFGIFRLYRDTKVNRDTENKVFSGGTISACGLIIAVCALFGSMFHAEGIKLMYVFVPCAAVLMLLYMLYSSDLCVITAVSGVSAAFMWYLSRVTSVLNIFNREVKLLAFPTALSAAGLVLLGAFCLAVRYLEKNKGSIKLLGKQRTIFKSNAKYNLCFVTAAVSAVSILAAIIFGATAAYYLIFAQIAWIFIMVVYYTVRMM